MNETRPSVSITSAVFFGAVLLVGLPAMGLAMTFFGRLLDVVGLASAVGAGSPVGDALLVTVVVFSVLIGLQLSVEAAALQLHGTAALTRGTGLEVLFRHVFLSLCALLALGASVWTGLSQVVQTGGLWPGAVSGVLGLAGLVVLFRYLRQLRVGYKTDRPSG